MPLLEDGVRIRDTYEVERFLGEGAFADVYRVKHRFLGRQAMKLMKLPGISLEELEQMLGEAVLLSRMHHPNIVRLFDANVITHEGQSYAYFTMEYVAGGSLDQFWRSYGDEFIPVPLVVDVMRQVCRGLAAAHSQDPPIVHRDIKPQNILVGYEADGLRARASDFGLAKRVNPLTLRASAKGTPCFKAPEAFDDYNSDSCAGDVWAIGTTLYLMLTDRLPFLLPDSIPAINSRLFRKPPAPPSRLNAWCDSRLDTIVLGCLKVDPEERYQNAQEVLAELEAWTPRSAETDRSSSSAFTTKDILGRRQTPDEESARLMAGKALLLAQDPSHLNDAADMMEEAFNQFPPLREEYERRVQLWRRGISM